MGIGLLVLLGGVAVAGSVWETPAEPADEPMQPVAATLAAHTVRDAFGVNEAVVYPALFVNRVPEEVREKTFDAQIESLHWMGVTQVRVHTATFPFLNWHASQQNPAKLREGQDKLLLKLLDAGLEPLVMISVWPGNAPANASMTYVPDELDAYTDWVTATVERYDGDGLDDVAGLPRGIHRWEYDNEPDLHHFAPPRDGAPAGFDQNNFSTPAQFAQLAIATAEAIRRADADASVLPGGLWRPFDERLADYAVTLYQQPGFAEAMSGLNVHAYPPRGLRELWTGLEHVRSVAPAGTPAWITETSVSSLERGGERVQAILLVEAFMGALSRGVEALYWHSLNEAPSVYDRTQKRGTTGRHLFIGLEQDVTTNAQGMKAWKKLHPKLAAWTVRKLMAELGEVPRDQVQAASSEGAKSLQFGEDAWVVWTEGRPSRGGARLTVDSGKRFTVTELIPRESDGAAINGEATFVSRSSTAQGGVLSLPLERGPVLVRRER